MKRITATITGPQSVGISLSQLEGEDDCFFIGEVRYIGGCGKDLEREGMPAMLRGEESQGGQKKSSNVRCSF